MGVIEFFILCVVLVALGYLTVLAAEKLAPNHPKIIDGIIWFVVVLVILVTLSNAMGLLHYDPQIPRVH